MFKKLRALAFCLLPVVSCLGSGSVQAQQVNGTLGSPSATTTVSNKQLPAPDPKFGGVIKEGALQSKPWWPPTVVPPRDAPNVLLIITDDAGFGVPSTFGGVIPTPTMDRLAKEGLRYNRMFSTALCSPTRAALITGRNHHTAGFGVISEQSTGFPGYNSISTDGGGPATGAGVCATAHLRGARQPADRHPGGDRAARLQLHDGERHQLLPVRRDLVPAFLRLQRRVLPGGAGAVRAIRPA